MEKIAIYLRTLQLYGQNAHNLDQGQSFFADHEALGAFYEAAGCGYDMVIERMIGLDIIPDLQKLHKKVAEIIQVLDHKPDAKSFFRNILKLEQKLCSEIEECVNSGKYSEGTNQLIGELANQSESRQYKIKQRLK